MGTRMIVRVALLAAAGASVMLLAACGSDDPDLLESATGPAIAVGVQTEGGEYLTLLHAGTCEAAGASAGRFGTLQADVDGRATLTTSTVLVVAVGALTDLTPALLSDGDHVVRVVRVGDDEAVCVAVP